MPEALREKQKRQNAQANGDAEKQKAPIHGDSAPPGKLTTLKLGLLNDGAVFTA